MRFLLFPIGEGDLNLTADLERSEITLEDLTRYQLINEEEMEPLFLS